MEPEFASALLADVAVIANVVESSFRMVPVAVAVVMLTAPDGPWAAVTGPFVSPPEQSGHEHGGGGAAPSSAIRLDFPLPVNGALAKLEIMGDSDAAFEADPDAAAGDDRLTVKDSLPSTRVSPATLIVTIWLVWPAAKLTTPEGNTPPAKSPAFAGLAPDPVTA